MVRRPLEPEARIRGDAGRDLRLKTVRAGAVTLGGGRTVTPQKPNDCSQETPLARVCDSDIAAPGMITTAAMSIRRSAATVDTVRCSQRVRRQAVVTSLPWSKRARTVTSHCV